MIGFVGSRDGKPFEGGSSDRMPLVIGEERLIPGFEAHIVGARVGDHVEFDLTFPDDYGEASLAGQPAHFAVDVKELREKVLPPLDDEFATQMGDFKDLVELRDGDPRTAREERPRPRPARSSATGSSSTPWPTRPSPSRRSWSTRRSR